MLLSDPWRRGNWPVPSPHFQCVQDSIMSFELKTHHPAHQTNWLIGDCPASPAQAHLAKAQGPKLYAAAPDICLQEAPTSLGLPFSRLCRGLLVRDFCVWTLILHVIGKILVQVCLSSYSSTATAAPSALATAPPATTASTPNSREGLCKGPAQWHCSGTAIPGTAIPRIAYPAAQDSATSVPVTRP